MWCLVVLPNTVVLEVQVPTKAVGQECLDKVSELFDQLSRFSSVWKVSSLCSFIEIQLKSGSQLEYGQCFWFRGTQRSGTDRYKRQTLPICFRRKPENRSVFCSESAVLQFKWLF